MVAERFAPRIDARERRRRDRDADDADRDDEHRREQIGHQRDAERRRPSADLQHLDAVGLDVSEQHQRAANSRTIDPASAIHRCSSGRFGASSRTIAVIERHEDREHQRSHRSLPISSTSSVPTVA